MPDTDAFGDSFGSCGGTETQRESVPAGRERAGSRENTVGSNHIYPAAGEIRLHCEGGRKPEQSTENIKKSVGGAAGGTIFQIDRGYLCNVTKVTQLKNDKLTLTTGEELYVSSARMRELKDKVMEYWIREKKI